MARHHEGIGIVDHNEEIELHKKRLEVLDGIYRETFNQETFESDPAEKARLQYKLKITKREMAACEEKIKSLEEGHKSTRNISNDSLKNEINNLGSELRDLKRGSRTTGNTSAFQESSPEERTDKNTRKEKNPAITVAIVGVMGTAITAAAAILGPILLFAVQNNFRVEDYSNSRTPIGDNLPSLSKAEEDKTLSKSEASSPLDENGDNKSNSSSNDNETPSSDDKIATNDETENTPIVTNGLNRDSASRLIEQWLEAKKVIFGPSYNREVAHQFLMGSPLADIQNKSEGAVTWLDNNNAYYYYGHQEIGEIFLTDPNENRITWMILKIYEERQYYQRGRYQYSEAEWKSSKYEFMLDAGTWKISDYCICQDDECMLCDKPYD